MKAKQREDVEEVYKWKLEDIFNSEESWQETIRHVDALLEEAAGYQGMLGQAANKLLDGLRLMEKIERSMEKVYVYAKMRRDEDNSNSHYQEMFDRAQRLAIEADSALSFILPELNAIPENDIRGFMDENCELLLYEHFFQELWRQKEHILSEKEEKILAMTADLSMASNNIFSMLNNADIKFPVIRDEEGKEIELTKGRYGRFMESHDRRVRKEAFEAMYGTYGKLINTLGASLSASVKKDIFYARVRNYPSALVASLDQDNISPAVYDNLIKSVHDNLEPMYRYMALRKKILGLEDLHMYDIYTPLVPEYNVDIGYEQAREQLVKGLEPLGSEYLSVVKNGLDSGWIDVYENEGKTSGAYSWGSYDTHPYILMNYDNKFDDLFTLAHEMGHAMHSYYSNCRQPYIYSQYTIFVAEVASTVNESLLLDYLLQNSEGKKERMYLLNHYLEQFRGTVYRQTMFAEFEKIIHEKAELGEALTPARLREIYMDLNRLYYGPDVVLDDNIGIEWTRIPHFYSAFYVYKYATGFSAATAIKQKIISEGEKAVQQYMKFLSAGASDYPLNILKIAGVDLSAPAPVDQALHYFNTLVKEMEEMI